MSGPFPPSPVEGSSRRRFRPASHGVAPAHEPRGGPRQETTRSIVSGTLNTYRPGLIVSRAGVISAVATLSPWAVFVGGGPKNA